MIEKYPLEKANEAFARMVNGKGQFRVVLTMWTVSKRKSGRVFTAAGFHIKCGRLY